MRQNLMYLTSFVLLLGLVGVASAEVDLKVDIGCPGQEVAGNLKAGWTAFDGTACSGSVGPVIPQSLWPFKGWWYVMASVLASGHNGIISVGLRLRNAD